jgi:hypothetical protein
VRLTEEHGSWHAQPVRPSADQLAVHE